MLIEPGISTYVPGSQPIDLFPLNKSYDFDQKPLLYLSNEITVKKTDLLLTDALFPSMIEKNELSRDYVGLNSNDAKAMTLLSSIKMYDALYIGSTSLTSNYSCQVLAFGLKDRYDIDSRRLIQNPYIEHDYFNIIANEVNQRRTLIAFDKSWVLPGIIKYIEDKITYSIGEPVNLREKLATYNSDLQREEWSEFVETSQRGEWSEGRVKGREIKITDLTTYNFNDLIMVFAPVNIDEAEKIFLYLYRDTQLYTLTNYLTLKDVPINKIKDFQYLFPVEVRFMNDYVFVSSDQMTLEKLQHMYNFGEVQFEFPRLNDLTGAFASYLLAERTFFQYSIRWENNILYVGLCGYIQAMDLFTNFGLILVEIQKERPFYKEVLNYKTATSFVANSDSKAFYHIGKYYLALNTNQEIPLFQQENYDHAKVELSYTLVANTQETRKYLKDMGYDVTPSSYSNNLQLGYHTYEIDGNVSTVYYYSGTNEKEIELHEVSGGHDKLIQAKLETLLQKGYFFTQKMKNITRGYIEFTPSDPPINKKLYTDSYKLNTQLDSLIKNLF
jgi:hypothetical protein